MEPLFPNYKIHMDKFHGIVFGLRHIDRIQIIHFGQGWRIMVASPAKMDRSPAKMVQQVLIVRLNERVKHLGRHIHRRVVAQHNVALVEQPPVCVPACAERHDLDPSVQTLDIGLRDDL